MSKIKKPSFPQFDKFAIEGDSIKWEKSGFDFTATLVRDNDAHVDDSDCYSKSQVTAWRNDEWFFVGVVVSVSKNGVELDDHAAALWGVECNFPSRRENPNLYLSEVAQQLEGEALERAIVRQAEIIKALS